jgi:hypothetical protein
VDYAVLNDSASYLTGKQRGDKMATYFSHEAADGADLAVGDADVETYTSGS